jgi:hypothetical protein
VSINSHLSLDLVTTLYNSMATHAHLMIDPLADGTPVLPAAFEGHEITTVESRASYRKEKDDVIGGEVEEVPRLEDNAQAPEGPTTGKYEEWAYVGLYQRWGCWLTGSTSTTMVTRVLGPTDTHQHSSKATSTKLDETRLPADLVPMLKGFATSSSQETGPSHPLS